MIIFYAAWAYQESLIEEKMKEIKENLESLSNPAANMTMKYAIWHMQKKTRNPTK